MFGTSNQTLGSEEILEYNNSDDKSYKPSTVSNSPIMRYDLRRKKSLTRPCTSAASVHAKNRGSLPSSSKHRCIRPATFKYQTKYTPYPANFIDRFAHLCIRSSSSVVGVSNSGSKDAATANTVNANPSAGKLSNSSSGGSGAVPFASGHSTTLSFTSNKILKHKKHRRQHDIVGCSDIVKSLSEFKITSDRLQKKNGRLFDLASRCRSATDLSCVSTSCKIVKLSKLHKSESSPRCKPIDPSGKCWIASPISSSSTSGSSQSSATNNGRSDGVNFDDVDSDLLDLTSYMENYFHLPKQMSSMAEMMYA